MNFRRANDFDAEEIVILRKNTFEKINGKNLAREVLDVLNKKNGVSTILDKMKKREMFCLIENENIVGTVDLNGDEIGGVFVRYDLVGKGIGTKLMDFIEKYSKNKGLQKVFLRSTKYVKEFYIKRGYGLMDELNFSSGGVNLYMEKNLI